MKKYLLLCSLFGLQACTFGGFSAFAVISAMVQVVSGVRKSGSWSVLLAVLLLQLVQHTCWAEAGEILLAPESQRVPLGDNATFFCRTYGFTSWTANTTRIPANGERETELTDKGFSASDVQSGLYHNTTLTVEATVENNNTEISCTAFLDGTVSSLPVLLFIYGPPDPPPAPRVHIESLDRIWFSWNRPFAFENYSITNFTISVQDHPEWTRVVTEELDRESFSLPITADSATLSECEELFFSVMAMNKIGASDEAFAAAGGFPIEPEPQDVLFTHEVKYSAEFQAEIFLYIQVPRVCPYQEVGSRVFISNSSDEQDTPIGTFVTQYGELQDGIQVVAILELELNINYTLKVETYTLMNNSRITTSLQMETFETVLPTQTQTDSVLSKQEIFIIAGAGAGGLLLAFVLLAIIIMVVTKRHHRHRLGRSRRPSKQLGPPPMVPNPIYEGGTGPVYETIDQRFVLNNNHHHQAGTNYTAAGSSAAPLNNAILNTESPYKTTCVDPSYAEATTLPRHHSPEDSYTVMLAAGTTAPPPPPGGMDAKECGGESSLDFNSGRQTQHQQQFDETMRYVPEPGTIQISEC